MSQTAVVRTSDVWPRRYPELSKNRVPRGEQGTLDSDKSPWVRTAAQCHPLAVGREVDCRRPLIARDAINSHTGSALPGLHVPGDDFVLIDRRHALSIRRNDQPSGRECLQSVRRPGFAGDQVLERQPIAVIDVADRPSVRGEVGAMDLALEDEVERAKPESGTSGK